MRSRNRVRASTARSRTPCSSAIVPASESRRVWMSSRLGAYGRGSSPPARSDGFFEASERARNVSAQK